MKKWNLPISVIRTITQNIIYWILILLIVTIPLLFFILYKVILTGIAKTLHSNWSCFNISDAMTFMDVPNVYSKNPLFSIGFILKIKKSGSSTERFSVTKFREHFVQQLLGPIKFSKVKNPGPVHKNLFCFIQTFGGLAFKQSLELSDLNIEELITEHEISEEDFNEFIWDFYYKVYKVGKPMWNISVLNVKSKSESYCSEQLYLLFRIHHAMGDGYSFIYLLEQLATGEKLITIQNDGKDKFGDFDEESWKEKIKLIASAPAKFLELAKTNLPPYPMKMSGFNTKMHYLFLSLNLQTIKTISKKSGTNFQSVLLTLLGGCLRKMLLETKIVANEEHLPEYVYSPFPLPWPHPKHELCNEWSMGVFKTPIKNPNPQERLLETDKDYKEFHDKGLNKLCRRIITPLFSLVPVPWFKLLTNSGVPSALSAIVGGANYKLLGNEITHVFPFGGMIALKNAIYLVSLSHSNKMDLTIGINHELSPDGELAKRFVNDFILQELESLKRIYADD